MVQQTPTALPEAEYLSRIGQIAFQVSSLEWTILGDLGLLAEAIPHDLTVDHLAGLSTGVIAYKLREAAQYITSEPVKDYVRATADVLEDASVRRNHLLHARTATIGGQQRLYRWLSFSHGTRNLPLTITATSIHPGGGPDIAASSTGLSLDGNGDALSPSINMPPSTYATATFNVYGIATPITIVIRNSATGQVLAEFEEQIGPCFNPSIGTVAVTPSCSANGQAQWSAGLSNFDGLSILTVTATAQGPNGPVSDSVMVTTNNGGFATITARDFGNPGDFPVGTGLTITVSEGGTTVATYPNYVIGPCGSPAAAGSSPKIRSGSSSPKLTPTRTAPSTAPATSSSTAPAPPGTPPASPSPASPPTSGKS